MCQSQDIDVSRLWVGKFLFVNPSLRALAIAGLCLLMVLWDSQKACGDFLFSKALAPSSRTAMMMLMSTSEASSMYCAGAHHHVRQYRSNCMRADETRRNAGEKNKRARAGVNCTHSPDHARFAATHCARDAATPSSQPNAQARLTDTKKIVGTGGSGKSGSSGNMILATLDHPSPVQT